MLTEQQKQLVKKLIDGCRSHDEWLMVIRFGLETLLQDQPYFIDLVITEAGRNAVRGNSDVENVSAILQELGVRLVAAASPTLLEACIKARQYIAVDLLDPDLFAKADEIYQVICDAISRATKATPAGA